ncbi:pantoate--beta-alanine ligase [Candidatus Latescibacterota bacterium]
MIDIIYDIQEMSRLSEEKRSEGLTIGLVPTMGALHEGHLSLVKKASECVDFVVVSVFVNPTQFGPNEDFEKYPRDMDHDISVVESAEGNLIFAPTASSMYPDGYATYVTVDNLTDKLCGASRPKHFSGVTTVVSKLFNIVRPHHAFFGMKDAQQLAVIKRMTRDLDIPVEITGCPIVREPDGLAMSSRNSFLSAEERDQASVLFRSLQEAKTLVESGVTDAAAIINRTGNVLEASKLMKLDYIEIVDPVNMTPVDDVSGGGMIALAAWFGTTRLIDNVLLHGKG